MAGITPLTTDEKIRYAEAIKSMPSFHSVVTSLDFDPAAEEPGSITYDPAAVRIDKDAWEFSGYTHKLNDEEFVRALLVLILVDRCGFPADGKAIHLEKSYKAPGRPKKGIKGGRVDVIVYDPAGDPFLFIEAKRPAAYDSDKKYIDTQLFQLCKLEEVRPKYLVYYTCDAIGSPGVVERMITIDAADFESFDSWSAAGQPSTNTLPKSYGKPTKKMYGNVDSEDDRLLPLNRHVSEGFFAKAEEDIHDIIWGGGGTASNEVFAYITRLILCKIVDEKETRSGESYSFQRRDGEGADELVARLNAFYRDEAESYLTLTLPSQSAAFDPSRVAPSKIAFVVGTLEGVSLLNNDYPGDLLGEFFEQIVSKDFTQTKGQFFAPSNLIEFMLDLVDVEEKARTTFMKKRDRQGRCRLPYVIDPCCGSGSILIAYMKRVSACLRDPAFVESLNQREREFHSTYFGDNGRRNTWAQDYLYGVETNYDLGVAVKVNMILHGDGSTNTWIADGLTPFEDFYAGGRGGLLGESSAPSPETGYANKVNEQFDLIMSNPPFSISMTDEEKKRARASFGDVMGLSENLFIERWYQLLRPGGEFCCILPESVLDVSTNEKIRLFLISRFKIKAVVSLPYSSFQPYTSTKTCIVYAEKRSDDEAAKIVSEYRRLGGRDDLRDRKRLLAAVSALGLECERTFMAEPAEVGYKRRKGLPDLSRPDDLRCPQGKSVISSYRQDSEDDSVYGFYVTLEDMLSRPGSRLDPKYRWLWDKEKGEIGNPDDPAALSDFFEREDLPKVQKGALDSPRSLIDLAGVKGGACCLAALPEEVIEINSDKVELDYTDIIFSQLEAYLGKILPDPPSGSIGSTEWQGLKNNTCYSNDVAAFILALPELREAYRRLQSGKRHARVDIEEVLELKISSSCFSFNEEEIIVLRNEMESYIKKIRELYSELERFNLWKR